MSSTRPDFVCVSFKSPLPPTSGSRQRIRNVVEAFASVGDVHLVIVDDVTPEESAALGDWSALTSLACVVPRPRRPGLRENIRWVLGRGPIGAHRKRDVVEVRGRLQSLVDSLQPSAVWVPAADAEAYLPVDLPCPLVVDVAHVEGVAIRRERAILLRDLRQPRSRRHLVRLMLEAHARRTVEARLWRRAELLVPVSDAELDEIRKRVTTPSVVVPNGVDLPATHGRRVGSARLLFVGNLHYLPNADAARWLVQEILPAVRARRPEVTVDIVGAGPAAIATEVDGVRWLGFVDDIATVYAQAELVVVPLRAGSGTKLKVIEAFAFGVPVVSTTIGIEGLAEARGEMAAVADTVSEFAGAVLGLLDDPQRATAMADAARSAAATDHSWDAIRRQFAEAVRGLVSESG